MPWSLASEPWFVCVLLQCDSVVNSEPQISLAVPWFHFHQRSPTSSVLFRLQLWFAPEVGPASDLRSGSVPPRGRSRPQFQLLFQTPYKLQPPRQSLRSLRGSGGTRHGWYPRPLHQYHSADPGGPGPPSGPVLLARVSHPHPGLSRHLLHQLQRRHHRHSYRLPPGSGGRYSSGTPSRGMCGSTAESFNRSRTMLSQR